MRGISKINEVGLFVKRIKEWLIISKTNFLQVQELKSKFDLNLQIGDLVVEVFEFKQIESFYRLNSSHKFVYLLSFNSFFKTISSTLDSLLLELSESSQKKKLSILQQVFEF